jgi:hypothetical protein
VSTITITIYSRIAPLDGRYSGRSDIRPETVNECIQTSITILKPDKVDFDLYQLLSSLCEKDAYDRFYLEDFVIRREKLVRQELDERVILWLVVSITVAGVLLAGVQLYTSYRLVMSGRQSPDDSSELTFQRDKLSLKSSIAGLVILALSLAFFVIYVWGVYTQRETTVDPIHVGGLLGQRGQLSLPKYSSTDGLLTPNRK